MGELDRHQLSGAHLAAPFDAFAEALAAFRGGNEFPDKLIIRFILQQGLIQPRTDLLPPAIDITGAGIIVAEEVVPERQPMLGIGLGRVEQERDGLLAFSGGRVGEESRQLLRRRQQSDEVQIHPA